MGSIPGSGRFPGEGYGNPLQDSFLENPMDRGTQWATVHGVTKSQTRLKWFSMHAWMTQCYELLFPGFFFFFLPCCPVCGILVSWPRFEPEHPAMEVQNPNHWTMREVHHYSFLYANLYLEQGFVHFLGAQIMPLSLYSLWHPLECKHTANAQKIPINWKWKC